MADDLKPLSDAAERARRLRPILDAVGIMMVSRQQDAFVEQQRGSQRWGERMVPNVAGVIQDLVDGGRVKARRFTGRPAGRDTGALFNSINYEVVGTSSVKIGSALSYAERFHAGGTSVIPVPPSIMSGLRTEMRAAKSGSGHPGMLSLGWLFHYAKKGIPVQIEVQARPFATVEQDDLDDVRSLVEGWVTDGGP